MNGLQVVAGLVLLCMILWLVLPFGNAKRTSHRLRPLPPDVYAAVGAALPQGWSLGPNTPVGAAIFHNGEIWGSVYSRFSTLGGNDYPESRIVFGRKGMALASTWALSPAAAVIITGHILAAIKQETQHHDDTH